MQPQPSSSVDRSEDTREQRRIVEAPREAMASASPEAQVTQEGECLLGTFPLALVLLPFQVRSGATGR